jgi:hypothetical protein
MPPWRTYVALSATCDVDYIHRGFMRRASAIGEVRRGRFADGICADAHKKKFITTELPVRLKNLHLRDASE